MTVCSFVDGYQCKFLFGNHILFDHLCGLVVRVPGYRSRGRGSILDATGSFEK
jgi:hypothetical protein